MVLPYLGRAGRTSANAPSPTARRSRHCRSSWRTASTTAPSCAPPGPGSGARRLSGAERPASIADIPSHGRAASCRTGAVSSLGAFAEAGNLHVDQLRRDKIETPAPLGAVREARAPGDLLSAPPRPRRGLAGWSAAPGTPHFHNRPLATPVSAFALKSPAPLPSTLWPSLHRGASRGGRLPQKGARGSATSACSTEARPVLPASRLLELCGDGTPPPRYANSRAWRSGRAIGILVRP